jgi:hypothetical protein
MSKTNIAMYVENGIKKAVFFLLLLPFSLYSQSNSIVYNYNTTSTLANRHSISANNRNVLSEKVNYSENDASEKISNSGSSPEPESNNTLPNVNLLNFHFECGFIEWSTASETNCSHFLIMYSRDKKNWNIIGQIYGAGNSSALNNYKYPTDLTDVYFKIYQVDFDGNAREYEAVFGSCKKQKKS